MASGALAVERGRYAVQFTPGPKSPMPAVKDSGSYVAVWRRESDGQWRAVWDAPVSEVPPPGTPR
jgi:ketosteroid isomerase-like protein